MLLPKLRDPRLHLAAVVLTLQVLGQTVLGFDLSIAQILVALGTCALIEFTITLWQKKVIAWPASALLTGNGVAILLRVPGTEHGDWWSLHGAHIFAAIAALAILSKYAIQVGGRHLFNPANFGLVIGLLVLGSQHADPQDLWWGPLSPAIIATLIVITLGAIFVTARNGLFGAAAGFFLTLAFGAAVLAASGHAITARWHIGPIAGAAYLWTLVSSPEILVFSFFMITDPRCVPATPRGKVAHGVAVGALACLFIAPQTTEFATKVGILAALAVVCAARPLLDRRFPATSSPVQPRQPSLSFRVAAGGTAGVLAFAGSVLAVGQLADASRTAPNAEEPTTRRNPIELPEGSVPKVVVGPSATRVAPAPTDAEAQQMGRALVEATLVEAQARQQVDANDAAEFVVGDQFAALERDIAAARDQPIRFVDYDFMTLELVRVPDPERPQAPPQFGFRATGTQTTGSVGGPTTTSSPRSAPIPIDHIFLVDRVSGNWSLSGLRAT